MVITIATNSTNTDYIDFSIDGKIVSAIKRICTTRIDPDDANKVLVYFNVYHYPAHAPVPLMNEELLTYLNGNKKTLILSLDWNDVSSPVVTSATSLLLQINLLLGNSASAQIYIDQTPAGGAYGTLAGLINGSNTTFSTSQGVYASGKLKVFLNGQLIAPGSRWNETNPAIGSFDFVAAPKTGNIITAEYAKP